MRAGGGSRLARAQSGLGWRDGGGSEGEVRLLRHVTLVGSARSGAGGGSFDAQDVAGQVVFIEVGGGRGGATAIPHFQSLEGGFAVRRGRVLCDHIAGRGYAMKRRCRARRRAPFALVLGGWVGVVRICIPLDFPVPPRSTPPSTALPLPSSPALPLLTFGGAAPPAPFYTTFPACT